MKKAITLFLLLAIISLASAQVASADKQKSVASKLAVQKPIVQKDTIKKGKILLVDEPEIPVDSEAVIKPIFYKPYKKNVHASYYADKFSGKRTSSGQKFDNNKYTAAHRKFPFGTKLKITNEANGKSVVVEVIDRGPFSRGREIDLTKKAFQEIASNKNSGAIIVKIEVATP